MKSEFSIVINDVKRVVAMDEAAVSRNHETVITAGSSRNHETVITADSSRNHEVAP